MSDIPRSEPSGGIDRMRGIVLPSIVSHSVASPIASSPTGSPPAASYPGSSSSDGTAANPALEGPSRHTSVEALRVQLFTVMQPPTGSPPGVSDRGGGEGGPHREASLGWALPGEEQGDAAAAQRIQVR